MELISSSKKNVTVNNFNLPNSLSLSRVAMVVSFCLSLSLFRNTVAAAICLAVAGFTDFLDGYVARHTHQVTELGKLLDPAVDRLVVVITLVYALAYRFAPLPLIIILLARDLILVIATLVLLLKKIERIDVVWFGKAGTFGIFVATPLYLLAFNLDHHHRSNFEQVSFIIATIIAAISIVFLFIAFAIYIRKALKAFAAANETGGVT